MTRHVASSRRPRRLRRLGALLLGSYVLYVVGFEIAMRSGLAERFLNRRPHRVQISIASAHSWFPFWATAAGIEARGQAPKLRWQARVDRASGWLSPLPFVGLFETRRNLPGWVERLLTVNDLAAECRFEARPPEFRIDDFSLPFRKSMIHARMRFGDRHKAGAMMIAWRKVALGLRFDDDRKRLKLVGVRDWYARQRLDRTPSLASTARSDSRELFAEEALAAIPFSGVTGRPVSIVEAQMELDELEERGGATAGAVARPPYAIVPGSAALGDLDGDGRDEAALLLLRDAAEGEGALYLAVVAERGGRADTVR